MGMIVQNFSAGVAG